MNRLKKFLTDTADSLLRVALRYPVEAALCIYACIFGAIQIEWSFDYHMLLAADGAATEMRQLPHGVFTMLPLTMLATLIVHTLVGRASRAWRTLYLLVPLLLTIASWLLGKEWFGTSRFFITSAVLAPLGLLMARRTLPNGPFVRQTLGYIRAAAVGGIFALTAMLSAMAIYHSVIYIFNIPASWEVRNLVDSYIVLFSWALLWPLTALARLDGYLSDEPQGTKTTDTLLNWILAPALLVYAAILYLYCLQILFTWSLPKGGVAYLVFGFTMALFTVKALQELVVQRRYDWFFDRISIFALPPLVLFWAGVMQRVGDYGLTDWRVYLIVCGAIMTAAVALFAARRTGRYYYIAATAFVLFFLTAYIPRFSATAFSLRSQTARAERLAGQTGLLDESGRLDLSRIDERDTAQLKRYRELYASLDYLDDHDTLLLADRFGIARSRELLGCFHSDRIRDYIQWGYELDTAEAAALTSSYSNSELRAPLRIDGYRYCYAPVSFSYNNGSSRYTTSGDTLRLYLPDGRELFRRSFDELFTERCDQLLYWPDDELLYTADNLLFYRTDSLLISFSWAEVSRGKHRYVALNVDKLYTK